MSPTAQPAIHMVSHDLSMTGAPRILLSLARRLKSDHGLSIAIASLQNGPLAGEAAEIAPLRVVKGPPGTHPVIDRLPAGRDRIRGFLRSRAENLFWRGITGARPALVYFNTVASLPSVRMMRSFACPCILHVHEMGRTLWTFLAEKSVAEMAGLFSRVFCASEAVQRNLENALPALAAKSMVVHEWYVPPGNGAVPLAADKAAVRARLGVSTDAFVIGGAGTGYFRKGADLLLPVVREVRRQVGDRPVEAIWAGAPGSPHDETAFADEMARFGTGSAIRMLGILPEMNAFFTAIDVFAMTSREDPFPLVMLEAARHGLPVVAFRGTGGAEEFLEGRQDLLAPYGDAHAFASIIANLLSNPERRAGIGSELAALVEARYSEQRQTAMIAREIHHFLGAGAKTAEPSGKRGGEKSFWEGLEPS